MDVSFYPQPKEPNYGPRRSRVNMLRAKAEEKAPAEGYTPESYDQGLTPMAKQGFEFFLQQGWSPTAAAAIVARLQQESGPDFSQVRGDLDANGNPTAFGIGQWRGDRYSRLKAWATARGTSIDDPMTGFEYAHWELTNGPEKQWGAKLQSAENLQDALKYMHAAWRPAASVAVETARTLPKAQELISSYGHWVPEGGDVWGSPPGYESERYIEPMADPQPMAESMPPEEPANMLTAPRGFMGGPGSQGSPWFGSTNPNNVPLAAGQSIINPFVGYR
jgi:hypothetical protein